ncbi:helix-turn-helix domain-containing protein [Bradyrhizobium sp. USDA 4520]
METNDKEKIELLTAKEVAKLLQLSESKVRDLQSTRHLPFIKVGGAVRFEKRDIVEYLKRRKVAAMFWC